jgi:hypothetical protein
MEEIGLMPSDTGQAGGKRTGQRVSHYVIEGGGFDKAFGAMPPEYRLPWTSGQPAGCGKPERADKIKYECITCEVAVWGKAGLNIVCGDCGEGFRSNE